jgi:hypothetical protein
MYTSEPIQGRKQCMPGVQWKCVREGEKGKAPVVLQQDKNLLINSAIAG